MAGVAPLPEHYLITPAVGQAGDRRRFLRGFRRALQKGVRLAVLRDAALDDAAYLRVARDMAAEAAAFGAQVLLHNRAAGGGEAAFAAGVHFSAAALLQCRARPVAADRWFAASCHDAPELQAAVSAGADFVVLGPVRATPSHAGAAALGWPAFAALARSVPMPVFAVGGLGPRDVAVCRRHGGHGIAAIRALWGNMDDGAGIMGAMETLHD